MVTIQVCIGSACHLKGAYHVINGFQKIIEERNFEDYVTVKAAFCLGECTNAVSVKVDNEPVCSVSVDKIEEFFQQSIAGRLKK